MDEIDNTITLTDSYGRECRFEFLDLLTYRNDEYVILLPIEQAPDEAGEVVILKLEPSENPSEESYVSVEDEEELNAVFDLFKSKYKKEFDFKD